MKSDSQYDVRPALRRPSPVVDLTPPLAGSRESILARGYRIGKQDGYKEGRADRRLTRIALVAVGGLIALGVLWLARVTV